MTAALESEKKNADKLSKELINMRNENVEMKKE